MAATRRRIGLPVLLPLVWAGLALAGARVPGDEHSLWAAAALAGSWIAFVVRGFATPAAALPAVLVVGVACMAGCGLALRRWRYPRSWLLATAMLAALAAAAAVLAFTGGAPRAAARHGTLWAVWINAALAGWTVAAAIALLLAPLRQALRGGGG